MKKIKKKVYYLIFFVYFYFVVLTTVVVTTSTNLFFNFNIIFNRTTDKNVADDKGAYNRTGKCYQVS